MQPSIGMIGLGVLGSAIAPHLVESGYSVTGYDTNAEALGEMSAQGISSGESPLALAADCDVLILCLPSVTALHEVVSGADGIDRAPKPGQIVIEISTFPVAEKERARDSLVAVDKIMLDCPVSGNRIMALNKKLTAFGSGDRKAYDQIEPILKGFTRKTHYVGDFGCGLKMKFCGNILNLVHNSAAAEMMVLGIKSGLDPKLIHEVISGSGSSSAMFEVRGALMAENDYVVEGMNFSIPLKDAPIISAHAAALRCPTPIYQAALQPYYAAVAQGHGEEDAAAVCAALEAAANCVREK